MHPTGSSGANLPRAGPERDLGVFVLALFLSLSGAALGIALRIRAPLYTGAAFLIANAVGQLVRFYPDGRLAKAVMLMVMGAGITGTMGWFNFLRDGLCCRASEVPNSQVLTVWRQELYTSLIGPRTPCS